MKTADIKELSNFLLDYAVMLMRSGANTERTVRNVARISQSFGYETAIAIFQRNITMTIQDPADSAKGYTLVKQQMPPHLSLSIVNDLSALSWQSFDTDISLNEVKERYSEILSKAHSSNFIVLLFASFAIAVHIINSVTDILDGHVITGISRAVSSMILVICIAIGLYSTLSLTSWLFL